MPLSEEFSKNTSQNIEKHFPNNMGLTDNWYLVGYRYPEKIFGEKESEYIKFHPTKDKRIEF